MALTLGISHSYSSHASSGDFTLEKRKLDTKNKVKTKRKSAKSKLSLPSLSNAGIILTVLTILFYFLGIYYQSEFFRTYGIEINAYLFNFESYFVAIWQEIFIILLTAFGIASIFIFSNIIAEREPPKSAKQLKKHFDKTVEWFKRKILRIKARLLSKAGIRNIIRRPPTILSLIFNSINSVFYYLAVTIYGLGTIVVFFLIIYFLIEGLLNSMTTNARVTAEQQCRQKKIIQLELKPELKDKIALPEKTYFFSYLGDKYVVLFSENTDCDVTRGEKGFFILNRADIVKIDFPPNN